jgi:hypothetical protein
MSAAVAQSKAGLLHMNILRVKGSELFVPCRLKKVNRGGGVQTPMNIHANVIAINP